MVETSLPPWVGAAALWETTRRSQPLPGDSALGPPLSFLHEETKLKVKQRVSSDSFTAQKHCEERDLHPPNEQLCSE